MRAIAGIASAERAGGTGATKTSPPITKATLAASGEATASHVTGSWTCSRRSAPVLITETSMPSLAK